MSTSLSVKAFSSAANPEFQKHFKAVGFCLENKLSFPKETSDFFKGKVNGEDLENINPDNILRYLQNGMEVSLPCERIGYNEVIIKVSDIPASADKIIVKLD